MKEPSFSSSLLTPNGLQDSKNLSRAHDHRVRVLTRQGLDFVLLLSRSGVIHWASPGLGMMLGYASDFFSGARFLSLIHEKERAKIQQGLLEITSNGKQFLSWTIRLKHRRGLWNWYRVSASNFLDETDIKAIVITLRPRSE